MYNAGNMCILFILTIRHQSKQAGPTTMTHRTRRCHLIAWLCQHIFPAMQLETDSDYDGDTEIGSDDGMEIEVSPLTCLDIKP